MGEIHEDEKKKKKKLKEKAKGKKKINKKNKLMKGADPEKSSEAVPEQEVATTKEVENDKENLDKTGKENLAEEREKFEVGKKIALLEELRQEVEDYSDVSDREIDDSREVRMKDLSVSPINSDQSESFEKAATLDGLNPEAISPEEDFTSLSEEEEGEIKNYEKRKKLRLRKRELQKKVRELERQVIEISPNRGPLDISGLVLEEGEIH